MTTVVTIVCLAFALATVVVAGIRSLRDQPLTGLDLVPAAALEVAVLVYVGVRAVDLAGGHHPPSTVLVIAYLVGIALVMPVAVALGIAERSRWGPVVVVVGALTVAALFARIHQIWTPHG